MKQSRIHLWTYRCWLGTAILAAALCAMFAVDAFLTEDWNEVFMAACLFALYMISRSKAQDATRDYLHWWCIENGITNEDGYPITEYRP